MIHPLIRNGIAADSRLVCARVRAGGDWRSLIFQSLEEGP